MPTWTVKPSGGDYDSLIDCEATEQGTLTEDSFIDCYKGDYGSAGGVNYLNERVEVAGWSGLATYRLTIRTPLSERHNGKPVEASVFTGFALQNESAGSTNSSRIIYLRQENTRLEGFIISNNTTLGYGEKITGIGTYGPVTNIFVNDNIVVSRHATACGIAIYMYVNYSGNYHYAYGNLICSDDDGASHKWENGLVVRNGSRVYNNTVRDVVNGITALLSGQIVRNNIVQRFGTSGVCFGAGLSTVSHNLSDDATASGTGSVINTTLAFNDAANLDFSLHSTDTAAIGAGMDDPGSGLYSDDILGTAWTSPWDMGAFKYVSGGGTSINATSAAKTKTSYNSSVSAAVFISASSGAKSTTAYAATVLLGTGISASAASKSITANAAAVSIGTSIQASVASKSITAYQAAVSISTVTAISAAVAQKTTTAFAAAVSLSTSISGSLATKTVASYSAVVSQTIPVAISALAAVKNVTSYAAVVSLSTLIAGTTATKSVTSYAAVVDTSISTAINASFATKNVTTYSAVLVVPSEFIIEARRAIRSYKTHAAVVSATYVPEYSLQDLNETIPHASYESAEQQRVLIENIILIKALLNEFKNSAETLGMVYRGIPLLKNYAETVVILEDVSGVTNISLRDGNICELTLVGDTELVFEGTPANFTAGNITLIVKQDAVGGWLLQLPAGIKWDSGSAPTLNTDPANETVLTFFTYNKGASWYGFLSGDGMA